MQFHHWSKATSRPEKQNQTLIAFPPCFNSDHWAYPVFTQGTPPKQSLTWFKCLMNHNRCLQTLFTYHQFSKGGGGGRKEGCEQLTNRDVTWQAQSIPLVPS